MTAIANASESTTAPATRPHFRHRGPITCVAHVPHTRLAVTSGYDGAVGLFDLDSGRGELLGYHDHLVNRVAVSDDGTKAATSSSDYTIGVWDLDSRRLERTLEGHSDDVEDFVFIDSRTGVSASRDHRIIYWNLETGAVAKMIHDHERDVLAVAAAGGKIYSSGDDMTMREWSYPDGRNLRTWGPFENETDTCAIDTIHRRAVLGCDDGQIRIFSLDDGSVVQTIDAHNSGIKKVATSPVTGDIVSAAYDQRVVVWSSETFEATAEMESSPIMWERSLNWSADGKRLLAGTFDGTVLEWDAATGRRLGEYGNLAGDAGNACFNEVSASGDGSIALVSDDGFVRTARLTPSEAAWIDVVEPASGRMLMNAVTFDRPSHLVVTGAHNHALHIFTETNDRLSNEIQVFLREGPLNCVRVSHYEGHEDEIYAACYSGAIVRVARDGSILGRFRPHDNAVKALRLHPTRPLGVSCSADGSLVSWTLDGQALEEFLGHTAIVDDVDINPSGDLLCSVSRDFTLKVYAIDGARMRHSLRLGHRSPKSVSFFDDETVVVGDYWGALLRADLRSGKIVKKTISRNGISSLSRDGEHLVATSYDGSVKLVRVSDLEIVNSIRAMTQRLDQEVA